MRLLAITLAFISYNAFAACPKLEGTYAACRSTTGAMTESTDMVVTQKIQNGVTVYTLISTDNESQERKTEELIADGKTRSESTNNPEVGTLTASMMFKCSGPKVIGEVSMLVDGTPLLEMEQQMQKNGSALEIDYVGKIFGMDFSDTVVCE